MFKLCCVPTNVLIPVRLRWLCGSVLHSEAKLAFWVGAYGPPNFVGPPWVFPTDLSMGTFCGLTTSLGKPFGEEKPLIEILSQTSTSYLHNSLTIDEITNDRSRLCKGPRVWNNFGAPCGAKQVGLAEGKLQARRYNSVAPRGPGCWFFVEKSMPLQCIWGYALY